MESVLTFLPAGDEILQEIYGDKFVIWQIYAHFDSHEGIYFILSAVFGAYLFGKD